MTTLSIIKNEKFNSYELTFSEKPAAATLELLKANKYRWNPYKKIWYGYKDIAALLNPDHEAPAKKTFTTKTIDAYMSSGGGFVGEHSHEWHDEKELKSMLLSDFKRLGINGVTIKRARAGYLTALDITIPAYESDFISLDQFKKDFEITGNGWIYFTDENGKTDSIYSDKYYNMPSDEQHRLKEKAALYAYNYQKSGGSINKYCLDQYNAFTPEFLNKVKAVMMVVNSYNSDESNSMVDYFDRAIYDDYYIKVKR